MKRATSSSPTKCSLRTPAASEPGHGQPAFDKQFVRDYLKANPDCNYDLPQDVIDKTIAKYLEAYKLLTGEDLA